MSRAKKTRDFLFDLLQQHDSEGMLPTSLQFLWYEAIMAKFIAKDPKNKRWIIEASTVLRESGRVPWDWVVDETRSVENYSGYPSVKAGLLAQLPYITIDPWKGKGILVVTESRSLKGVLNDIADKYRVQITSVNGQCAGFLHTKVAPVVRNGIAKVLYLGDYDLSGGHIESNTRSVLEKEIGRVLDWKRIALTKDQADGLPKVIKRDKRHKPPLVYEAVETEALGQRQIVELLEAALIQLLPEPLERVLEREKRQQYKEQNKIDA